MFCKHVYVRPAPAGAPTVATTTGAATIVTPPKAHGLVPMALGVALVVAAGGSYWLFRTSASTPLTSSPTGASGLPSISLPVVDTDPSLPVTPVAAQTDEIPPLELTTVVEGHTSIGGRFYLVDVRNPADVAVGQPAVVASGFDAGGHRILEQPGYSRMGSLAPGESAVVLVLIAEPPAGLTRVDLAPRPGRGFVQRHRAAEVVESTERASFGSMHEMVGTVRNGSGERLEFIQVVAVGRDAAGKPVSYADGFLTNHTLEPGGSSGFTLSIGTFETARPARWELVAFGR